MVKTKNNLWIRFKVTKFVPVNDNDNLNKTKKKLGKSPLSKVMSMSDIPLASNTATNNAKPKNRLTVKKSNKSPSKSKSLVKSLNKSPKSRFTVSEVNQSLKVDLQFLK